MAVTGVSWCVCETPLHLDLLSPLYAVHTCDLSAGLTKPRRGDAWPGPSTQDATPSQLQVPCSHVLRASGRALTSHVAASHLFSSSLDVRYKRASAYAVGASAGWLRRPSLKRTCNGRHLFKVISKSSWLLHGSAPPAYTCAYSSCCSASTNCLASAISFSALRSLMRLFALRRRHII